MAQKQTVTSIQPSFSAGELSPLLFGRVDLDKYRIGLALARNVYVDYRGGISNRPGTQFLAACKNVAGQPRLIPFIVSNSSAYVLEFGNLYVRFYQNGGRVESPPGTPVEVVTPYAVADLPLLKFTQSANVLTITHQSYAPMNLTQTGPTTFVLAKVTYGPKVNAPTSPSGSQIGGTATTTAYGYVITAVSADGKEESLPTIPVVIKGDPLSVGDNSGAATIKAIYNRINWVPSSSAPAYYKVYKVGPFKSVDAAAPTPMPSVFGFIGQALGNSFVDNNIAPDYSITPPEFQDPFSPGQISQVVPSGGSGYGGNIVNLTFTGGGGTGAAGYGIVDPTANTVSSVIITNPGKNYTTLPAVTDNGANNTTYTVTLGQLSGTYPACVTYFQQRRTFGSTINFPESVVTSQPGEYSNFDTSPISQASDSLTFSIASTKNNDIASMQPMSTGLLIFTAGSAFLVTGGGQGTAVTPSSIVALPQASFGASDLPPIAVNYAALYAEARGFTVRDMQFNYYVQNYVGVDRSILSSHLFFGHEIMEWGFSQAPFRLLHAVRDDGELLVFTYVPEQEIYGWTHYDTFGKYVSIATIPEGQEDAVYFIVQRLISGFPVYYVERLASRVFTQVEDAWFLDCALSLAQTNPAASIQISGDNTVDGAVTITASAAVFSAPNVGDTIWGANGGKLTVTTFTDTTHLQGTIVKPFPVYFNDPNNHVLPLDSGAWSLDTPVTTISGLDHLAGRQITALADGVTVPAQFANAGSITVPASTKVVAGLAYTSQVQTLKLDLGEPTQQGKLKNIPTVTVRLDSALGVQVGQDFSSLQPAIMSSPLGALPTSGLISGDIRQIIGAVWKRDGQLAFQQSLPLPFTMLADMPEVVGGETWR